MAVATANADDHLLLEAIAQVEGHAWSDNGGRYAIMPQTWRQHTTLPYRYVHDPKISTSIAIKHLRWIRLSLADMGMAATPYMLAGCWRSGQRRFSGDNAPEHHRYYAERVRNLYWERVTDSSTPDEP